jgi:hypothetical protein
VRINYAETKRWSEDYFSKALSGKQRVTSGLLKYILLYCGDESFYNGKMMQMKKRSMGAGVYEIWFEEKK